MREWYEIPKLSEYQHYTDRNPPWVKLHNHLLADFEFATLADHIKWLWIGLILLASRTGNRISMDEKFVKNQLSMYEPVDFRPLLQRGWLVHRMTPDDDDASKVLADCSGDRTEGVAKCSGNWSLSRGEQRRAEQSRAEESTAPRKRSAAGVTRFQEFWDRYPHRGGRKRGRKPSEALWRSKRLDDRAEVLLEAIAAQEAHRSAVVASGQFAEEWQDPVRWLRHERWADELSEVIPADRPPGVHPDTYIKPDQPILSDEDREAQRREVDAIKARDALREREIDHQIEKDRKAGKLDEILEGIEARLLETTPGQRLSKRNLRKCALDNFRSEVRRDLESRDTS